MTKDARDRVAAATIIANQTGEDPAAVLERVEEGMIPEEQMPTDAEIEHRQRTDAYNEAMRDYAPPFVQPNAQGDYLFTQDQLLRAGMTPAEIIKLQREGAVAALGGLREYDEEQEALSLRMKQGQQDKLAIIDGGNAVRTQLSTMERYFSGQIPNGHGDYCKRYPYVSPTDEIVGCNGYIFQIPKYKKVMLPTEVLETLYAKAQAMQQFDVVSAIYAARQFRPLNAGDYQSGNAEAFQAQVRNQHHVSLDLIPGNGAFGR